MNDILKPGVFIRVEDKAKKFTCEKSIYSYYFQILKDKILWEI